VDSVRSTRPSRRSDGPTDGTVPFDGDRSAARSEW
jgi:hypothetical protein